MSVQKNHSTSAQRTKITRPIVHINEDKCDGCGLCVPSCTEGAIQIIDGKARLVADNLCDGIGNCLGTCPRDAITIEQRPAAEFDEQAVEKHLTQTPTAPAKPTFGGCPGKMLRQFNTQAQPKETAAQQPSRLSQWPIQLHLVPTQGAIWDNAEVLIAADCTAFALGGFHDQLLADKTLVIACPKLDDAAAYLEKLTAIFQNNAIRSLTIARMDVPCCSGLTQIVTQALQQAESDLTLREAVIGIEGTLTL